MCCCSMWCWYSVCALLAAVFVGALPVVLAVAASVGVLVSAFRLTVLWSLPDRLPSSLRAIDRQADGEEFFSSKSLKMDAQEIVALFEAFEKIPPFVLDRAKRGTQHRGGIQVIRKLNSTDVDFVELSMNVGTLGTYFKPDIILYMLQGRPYREMDATEKHLWRQTIIHEVGEAYYDSLAAGEKIEFVGIYPWKSDRGIGETGAIIPGYMLVHLLNGDGADYITPQLTDKELPQHFLTSYSSYNPRDLFCECFMAYILHGAEFREKTEGSSTLVGTHQYYSRVMDVLISKSFVTQRDLTIPLEDSLCHASSSTPTHP